MLRRRWPLFLLAVMVLATAGLLIAALLVQRAPFDFLAGQTALTAAESKAMGRFSPHDDTYVFKADGAEFRSRASQELAKRGFEVFAILEMLVGEREDCLVRIHVDSRPIPPPKMGVNLKSKYVDSPGWVTVGVYAPHPSLIDRLKRLVGL